jgi:hypothetical protein
MNKGKGAWRVIAVGAGVAWVILLATVSSAMSDMRVVRKELTDNSISHAEQKLIDNTQDDRLAKLEADK